MPAEDAQDVKEECPLKGARVAFSGRLVSMTRVQARDLVRTAGGVPTVSVSSRTTLVVIGMHGWPLTQGGRVSGKLRQAQKLRERHGRPRIISEAEFLELLGLRERDEATGKRHPIDEVSDLLGVERDTLEQWEFLGLVSSRDGAYDFQDIVSLQAIADLVRRGVRPETVRRSLLSLSKVLPGVDRPLAQLQVMAGAGGEVVAQIGDALIAPDGQQLLGFNHARTLGDSGSRSGSISSQNFSLDPAQRTGAWAPEIVEDVLEQGVWLEEQERYEEAAERYRRAISLEPSRGEVHFNLANVMRAMGRTEAAEELYRLAMSLDEGDALARYNLADLLEEEGRVVEAASRLREAISLDEAFADAHFNLASCLERLNELSGAMHHWRRYLELDPRSEWSAIARDRLAAAGRAMASAEGR